VVRDIIARVGDGVPDDVVKMAADTHITAGETIEDAIDFALSQKTGTPRETPPSQFAELPSDPPIPAKDAPVDPPEIEPIDWKAEAAAFPAPSKAEKPAKPRIDRKGIEETLPKAMPVYRGAGSAEAGAIANGSFKFRDGQLGIMVTPDRGTATYFSRGTDKALISAELPSGTRVFIKDHNGDGRIGPQYRDVLEAASQRPEWDKNHEAAVRAELLDQGYGATRYTSSQGYPVYEVLDPALLGAPAPVRPGFDEAAAAIPFGDELLSLEAMKADIDETAWLERVVEACKL
jgi:hypothetical protein